MSKGHDILNNKGNASMKFIDLIEVIHNSPGRRTSLTAGDPPRTSALGISRNRVGSVSVIGVLPHNYDFKPKSGADRDMLVRWLQQLDYS